MNAPQAIGEFPQYERLLWRVLAALARGGYFVPPQDARDLLHDFYVEAWAGVKERFDPALSSFATYLSAAFYRFARRRIANLDSWRHRLVDIEEVSALPSMAPSPYEYVEHTELLNEVKRALERLPSLERQVLYGYLADDPLTERELAQLIGLSRYAVRELLTNAVGRVATELRKTASDSVDSLVAFYVWRDDRTPRQVASLLGLSLSDVQAARARVATQLLSSIRSFDTDRPTKRATMPYSVEELKAGLLASDFEAATKFIAEHVAEFRAAVESDEELVFSERETAFLEAHPERLGQLYELLGAANDDDLEEYSELAQALARSRSNAERDVGEAFRALAENLPERFRAWNEIFGPVNRQVSEEFRSHLMDEPSVKYGGAQAAEVTQYGLTPSSFHEATVSVQLLLDRVERMSRKGVPEEFAPARALSVTDALLAQYSDNRRALIAPDYFVAQIQGVRDIPAQVVRPLMRWLFNAAMLFPYLFEGYRVDEREEGRGLTFVHEPQAYKLGLEPELFRQWTRRRLEPAASHAAALRW